MKSVAAFQTQMQYARVAGFVFLLLIVLFMGGEVTISHIVGSGDIADKMTRIVAGEPLYRLALSFQMLTSVCTVVLAYALYATLRSVDENLACLAMCWRMGEAFIGGAASMIDFSRLSLYSDARYAEMFGTEKLQAAIDLTKAAGFASFNISTTFFSLGSTLFFFLFFKSRSIPRLLSAFGLFASIVVFFTSLGNLVFPEYAHLIQFGWGPIFVAEITTGIWLLVRGVRAGAGARSIETDT